MTDLGTAAWQIAAYPPLARTDFYGPEPLPAGGAPPWPR
jgi:hypothetical protein